MDQDYQNEKRNDRRRRVLKRVFLSFGEDHCGVDAVLKNCSESGAFLEFSDAVIVPDEFTMHNNLDGYKVDCKVVRRSGNSAGVMFTSSKSDTNADRRQVVGVPNLELNEEVEDRTILEEQPEEEAWPEVRPKQSFNRRKVIQFGKRSGRKLGNDPPF